ncbi:MAG: hypothetical protein ACOCV1_07885 [Bacillota bacterium]
MKRKYKITAAVFIINILSLAWYLKPYTPGKEVEYIFYNNQVNVKENKWLTFEPVDTETNTGFINIWW